MQIPWAQYAGFLGAGLAMGFGAVGSGMGLGLAATGAIRSMERQPAASPIMFRNMLVTQAVTETPAIFALVIALNIFFQARGNLETQHSLAQAAVYLAAGLCAGIGAMGTGLGSGQVGRLALRAIGTAPRRQSQLLMYMLIGQAFTETGAIFALVIAALMLNFSGLAALGTPETIHLAGQCLGAAFSMGFGAVGAALGIAYVAGKAIQAIGRAPEAQDPIRNAFFIGTATTESTVIFSLVISLLLLTQNLG